MRILLLALFVLLLFAPTAPAMHNCLQAGTGAPPSGAYVGCDGDWCAVEAGTDSYGVFVRTTDYRQECQGYP